MGTTWATIIGAIVGAVAAISGSVASQLLNWRIAARERAVGSVRIKGLLREARYYVDRAKNEIEHQNTVGIYAPGWKTVVTELRNRLDAGDNELEPWKISVVYAAAFCCNDTLFASEANFAKELLDDRVRRAELFVKEAQDVIGDPHPTAYYNS
jgi:hypothetical protein